MKERKGRRQRAFLTISLLAGVIASAASCGGVGYGEVSTRDASREAELTELFRSEGLSWIRAERDRHRSHAAPLSERDRRSMAAYFPAELLDTARVLVVDGFENPAFFSLFEESGEPIPLDLRRANAMALVDTILIAEAASDLATRDRMLFHELVHLMQYEVLGLENYMAGYTAAWARNSRRYRGIPHEEQAFELASRFWRSRGEVFSVEAEVRSLFGVASAAVSADRGR